MESLRNLLVILLPVLIAIAAILIVCIGVRIARERYLSKATLDQADIRELQIKVTETARRASIQQGMEIDLAPFLRKLRLNEPNRKWVMGPLFDKHVFGWYERTSNDGVENFLAWIARVVWNPTRTKVVVSQWVTVEKDRTNVVIERVMGPVVIGDVDNSTTHGHRAGGDVIGGDRVGRDKIGGNSSDVRAGGSVMGSANSGPTEIRASSISTERELSDALRTLAHQAQANGESGEVVAALHWTANMSASGLEPEAREQSRNQRVLDQAGTWVRAGLSAIVEGATGALTENWLVELLKG